jgi:hypothetical protein
MPFGCSDIGEALIRLELEIVVATPIGTPFEDAVVRLIDHERAEGDPHVSIICETDSRGRCSGKVTYHYTVRRRAGLFGGDATDPGERFEVQVLSGGMRVLTENLPALTNEQIHGLQPVRVKLVVPG